jgi:hypothetical protein
LFIILGIKWFEGVSVLLTTGLEPKILCIDELFLKGTNGICYFTTGDLDRGSDDNFACLRITLGDCFILIWGLKGRYYD